MFHEWSNVLSRVLYTGVVCCVVRLFLLGLLGVARAALGLAQRADGRVAVDLLVARQARLHRRRLLSAPHTYTLFTIIL